MSVSAIGVKFYFWLNLWYSALDLIKLFIDEIESECITANKSLEPKLSFHPKLRVTSSISHKKTKIQKNNSATKEIELRNIFSPNLKEELLDDSSIQNSKSNIVKKEEKGSQSKFAIIKNLK